MAGGHRLTLAGLVTQRRQPVSGRVAYLGIDMPLYRRSQRLSHGAAARPWVSHSENGQTSTPTYPHPP